jgi:phosphatidylglycerophosphate synthase
MIARYLRQGYEKVTLPFGKASARLGFGPDFWTYFSLVAGILAGVLLATDKTLLGILLVTVMNIADMLDGATARARGTSSRFGKVLDHVTDRYAEFAIFAGLMFGHYASPFAVIFATSGVIMSSYIRAKAESVGVHECTVGWAGRQEKLFLVYLGLVLSLCGIPGAFEYVMYIIGIISHWTMIQRLVYSRQQLTANVAPLLKDHVKPAA